MHKSTVAGPVERVERLPHLSLKFSVVLSLHGLTILHFANIFEHPCMHEFENKPRGYRGKRSTWLRFTSTLRYSKGRTGEWHFGVAATATAEPTRPRGHQGNQWKSMEIPFPFPFCNPVGFSLQKFSKPKIPKQSNSGLMQLYCIESFCWLLEIPRFPQICRNEKMHWTGFENWS